MKQDISTQENVFSTTSTITTGLFSDDCVKIKYFHRLKRGFICITFSPHIFTSLPSNTENSKITEALSFFFATQTNALKRCLFQKINRKRESFA